MLYLNYKQLREFAKNPIDLTLTSVVFELHLLESHKEGLKHLTLTSVVFELSTGIICFSQPAFNFNKCCI